jgi:predicted ester cyclase
VNPATEDVVRRYFDRVWQQGDAGAVADLLTEVFVDHDPPPGFGCDRAAHGELAASTTAAMRDRQLRIRALVSDGDLVAVRHETSWVQDGPLFGIPADGRRLTLTGIDLYRVRDGRIAESWHCENVAGLGRQARGPG